VGLAASISASGDHNRLGFALQLTTLRFLALILSDPLAVPVSAIRYVAAQLDIEDLTSLTRHAERGQTQREHMVEIRRRFGYRDFNEPGAGFALLRFLYAREWVSAERPGVLFDLAITWLIDHQVVLPGMSTLERLIATNINNYRTPTHLACLTGNTEQIISMLKQDRHLVNARDHEDTPLHCAAIVAVARLLIEWKADVNARGWMEQTPLHVAVFQGRADKEARLLLRDRRGF
jgi:hypothetical protein